MTKMGFGGGCHWCTEGVFQALRGVTQVDQGFVQSDAPADSWSEGVIVTFDRSIIPVATLCEVHLRTHSAARAGPVSNFVREADYRHQMTNLSPKITANCVFASVHSRGGRFHSWAA